jgi:hypothetical protein
MAMVGRLRKGFECKNLFGCDFDAFRIVGLYGRHAKIHCMLEDEGTLLVMGEYMAGAGLQPNSEDLANAITLFWPRDAGLQLATRTAREWLDRMGYGWKDFKKGL